MRILIDADGCPVVDIAVEICRQTGTECIILCDTSHVYSKEGAATITVSKGSDSVDFALVNMLCKEDVAVTQDYGLAAMCLAKGAVAMNQDGMLYDDHNIGSLLESRYYAKKIRNAGGRLKGPPKRKPNQNEAFLNKLMEIIENSR